MTALVLWTALGWASVVPREIVEGVGVEPFEDAPTDEAVVADRVDALAHRLRCPVCQGLSGGDSMSDAALGMKARIMELVRYGYTDEQITDYFVDRYGTWILLAPPMESHELLWILPWILVVAGGAGVLYWVSRSSRSSPVDSVPTTTDDDPYVRRVLDEVGE